MKTVLSQVLLFSFFILLIAGSYSSFTSLLNYIHKAHGQQHIWHAQAYFVINSLSCIFFNILIPNLKVRKLKLLAYCIPLSFLMIYAFTYLGFRTESASGAIICTVIAAIFSGIGSSTLWIVSGKYIHQACEVSNQTHQEGRFYGIFGGIMACSFFIGAILSASSMQLIQKKHDIYLILSALAVIGILYCKFLISDLQKPSQMLNELENERYNQNGELVNEREEGQESKRWVQLDFKFDKICWFKNLGVYKRMGSLMPFQFLNGITVGYIFHCAQDLVFAPQQSSKSTFLTISLIFVGFGSAVGAYTAGRFCDTFGFKKVFRWGVMICILSFLMGMLSLTLQIQLISLVTSFLSGFGMMYTNNMLIVICSKLYEGSMMVFATNRQMITVSFMLFNLGINVIPPEKMHQQMYYELLLFVAIGLGCLWMVRYVRDGKEDGGGVKAEQSGLDDKGQQELNEMDSKSNAVEKGKGKSGIID